MDGAEVGRALATLDGLEISVSGDEVTVRVPALDDGVRLVAGEVQRLQHIFGPRCEPAVELVMAGGLPLILLENDVVFAPEDEDAVLNARIPVRVSNAPHLVTYTEMERDARAVAVHYFDADEGLNLAEVGGTLLLLRCLIAGALRFGMRPVWAVGCWQSVWDAVGGDLMLPPFHADPRWDELCAEAAALTLDLAPPPQVSLPDPDLVTMADIAALAPSVTVARLDEEFLAAWRQWIRVPPVVFAECLLEGLPDGAQAELTLYPDGGGGVELRVHADGAIIGLLQLGFSVSEGDYSLDEIRISGAGKGTGLFQRLMFNTGALGRLLGFNMIRALATGIGSYALAVLGYPHDAAAHRLTTRGR
ncbi:hypothetical protein [Streptosporangium saharense]|uniref:hypothetical protein n=1 Tax=Streptosporangium saharense TaxID=1706840 RepID=UPI00342FA3B7